MTTKLRKSAVAIYLGFWFANLLVVALSEPFFGKKINFFVGGYDRYADMIKAAYSLIEMEVFKANKVWGVFGNELLSSYVNGYNKYSEDSAFNTIFHHTPFVFLFFICCAYFLSNGVNPYLLTGIFVIVILVFLVWFSKKYYRSILVALFIFSTFPFLFALQRANFPAIFNGLILVVD